MVLIINIPDDTKSLLKIGQTVNFDTPFLEDRVKADLHIPVAKRLDIPGDKIFNYLKKFVGDTIKKNDVLAEKKGLIGSSKIVCDSDGVVKEINHNTGELIVSVATAEKENVKAYFKGEVTEMDKKQIKLKVHEVHEYSLKSVSADFGGEAFYLKESSTQIFAAEMPNKILVSEDITPYLITKAEALGVSGFISLKNQIQNQDINQGQLKNGEDLKKILHQKMPYCLINKQYCKIYFYR